VDVTRPQRKTTTEEHAEKRYGERNMDGRLWLQSCRWRKIEEKRDTELDGNKWSVAYSPLGATRCKIINLRHCI